MFGLKRAVTPVPEAGSEAPQFNLPSAQGGQLRLSMRTVRGPVIVAFLRGPWSEDDVAYFQALAGKETEINHAGASIVGIGALEPDEAREFVRATGIKSYVLYDYQRTTTRQWGLLERDRERGERARPAVFLVGEDHEVIAAWLDVRPAPEELLARVSEITGLPRPAEEAGEERPKRAKPAEGEEAPRKPVDAQAGGKSSPGEGATPEARAEEGAAKRPGSDPDRKPGGDDGGTPEDERKRGGE